MRACRTKINPQNQKRFWRNRPNQDDDEKENATKAKEFIAKEFNRVTETFWSNDVSGRAQRILHDGNLNKKSVLPSANDITILTHWKLLHNINCAHLEITGPLLIFNGIVY